ncbi:pfs domain-containing protein [Histoplasma capsulatum]|uniref:Pfs domain-containing protein n=1 Tax=Ajellomyces capsulatus TaxID=5037 RepID=A0A8A1MMH1_AJECA|nr:pfs domain-containing protein [Histoplasma capsulatum]
MLRLAVAVYQWRVQWPCPLWAGPHHHTHEMNMIGCRTRHLLMFFYHLCVKLAIEWKTCFRVCVTSRHYPNISIPEHLSLNLELQVGQASGVFMWVVLVVDMLNKENDEGCSQRQLQITLLAIPDDLHMLFRNMLTRNKRSNEKFLLCMQWLLFAKYPLSPKDLYLAILSGTSDEDMTTRKTNDDVQPDRVMKYLLNCSKGLAEATGSRYRTMQFIHQSVDPNLGDNMIGRSHERLKQCCHNFIINNYFGPGKFLSCSSTHWRSFMGYATRRIQFLALTTNREASALYMAAVENLSNLIRILPSKLSYLEAESSFWVTPLSRLFRGTTLYQSLCEDTAKSKYFRDELERKFRHADGVSPLSYAAMYCSERMLDFLLETGRWLPDTRDQDGRTPLSNASYCSVDRKVIKLLLANPEVDPNSRDG